MTNSYLPENLYHIIYLYFKYIASQLKAGKGLTISVSFLKGNLASDNDMQNAQKVKARMGKS